MERTSISSKNYYYFYSNIVLPFEQPAEEEEEIIIQQFDANVGVQPPLEEGEPEPPCVPCIACMEQDAVIVSLFCGHLSFCLSCLAVYEEWGESKLHYLQGEGYLLF